MTLPETDRTLELLLSRQNDYLHNDKIASLLAYKTLDA